MTGLWARTIGALLATAATLGFLATAALAQQAGGESTPPPGPPKWLVSCTNTAADGSLRCSMSQSILIRNTGQRLVTIVMRKDPGQELPAMMLTLPFGFFLPDGVSMFIDDEASEQLPIQTCDAGGCYAGLAVSRSLLDSMRFGAKLTFVIKDLQKREITIDATLEGFDASFEKLI